MKVHWTQNAVEHLADIYEYIEILAGEGHFAAPNV
jgi:plasmid stabilization system protein ParE